MAVPGRVKAGGEGWHVDEATDEVVEVAVVDPSELELTADDNNEVVTLIVVLEKSGGVVEDDAGRV